jgi:hypothetical protein
MSRARKAAPRLAARRFDGGFTGALRHGEGDDDNDHSRHPIIVQVWRITKALGWTKPASDLVGWSSEAGERKSALSVLRPALGD